MLKHYKTIINLTKNEFKVPEDWDWQNLASHFEEGKDISEEDYRKILTGEHRSMDMSSEERRRVGDTIAQSKHNNPSTNSKIFKEIIREKPRPGSGHYNRDWHRWDNKYNDALRHLAKRGNLSGEDIDDWIEGKLVNPLDGQFSNILENKKIGPNHLEKYALTNPDLLSDITSHESFNNGILERLLDNEGFSEKLENRHTGHIIAQNSSGYRRNGDPLPDQEQVLNLNPRIVRKLVEHHSDEMDFSQLNVLLDHVDPTFKKKWTDEKLGITDGVYGHTTPDEYDNGVDDDSFKEENWENWFAGDGYDKHIAKYLAGSRHIDNDQAEHIKRHANFDEKYSLYHNEHVDPSHGVQMFQKWHDDDEHHGYDAEELVQRFKEDKDDVFSVDDLPEEVLEELREEAMNSNVDLEHANEMYPITEWIDDNKDDIVERMGSEYDDMEEIHNKLHEDYYEDDWVAENPNSIQNRGNPKFDALNKLWESYSDDSYVSLSEFQRETGLESPDKIGLEADDDGDIDVDHIKDRLEEFGGPAEINYLDSEDVTIHDHPEYEERYEEAAKDWRRKKLQKDPWEIVYGMYLYEDHRESERYQEYEEEAINDYVEENSKNHMDELYDSSHQDTRFIPSHLHPHIPNFAELHQQNKAKILDGGHRSFLNEHIKDRSYEHEYGEDQHFYEMVKDHAEAKGGSIDIGTMNKLYPSQKNVWKKIFGNKGKISSDEATQKLADIPKTKYEISYGKWDGSNMQNVNRRDQIIFRLDHSTDSLKPLMDDPDVYNTFKRVQEVSKQSGHPTRNNTIAWARVDTNDPKHWMIDEVQSDFGKTVTRYLKEQGAEDNASHIDKIANHHKDWRESLTNAVMKEARKHGVEKISTHSPESKANHTSSSTIHSVYKDSYKKVPRRMGFQPTEAENLPLTDKGKQHFNVGDENEDNNLQGHTYHLTPKFLKKHMDDCLAYLEALEKGEIGRAARGAVAALGLTMGAHYMDPPKSQQRATEKDIPKHARSVANMEVERDPIQEASDEAKKEAEDIVYRNNKKWFLNKYSEGLSPHVYKQTVKNNPELSDKWGYINKLSNNTFKEVVEKNPHFRNDVHNAHYDKLHNEFNGDHEKMMYAWKNGVRNTWDKFGVSKQSKPGEQVPQEQQEKPNFTHRRMFKTHR